MEHQEGEDNPTTRPTDNAVIVFRLKEPKTESFHMTKQA
jgi:hypothetical protein